MRLWFFETMQDFEPEPGLKRNSTYGQMIETTYTCGQ